MSLDCELKIIIHLYLYKISYFYLCFVGVKTVCLMFKGGQKHINIHKVINLK